MSDTIDFKPKNGLTPRDTNDLPDLLYLVANSTLLRAQEAGDTWAWCSAIANRMPLDKMAEELRNKNLVPLDTKKMVVQQLMLHSQFRLFQIFTASKLKVEPNTLLEEGKSYPTETTEVAYAYPQDIQAIEKCPVLLTSHLQMEKHIYQTDRVYPPPEHGTGAHIFTRDETTRYTITDLAPSSQVLQQRIAERLEEREHQPQDQTRSLFERDQELRIMIQQLASDYYEYHLTHEPMKEHTNPAIPLAFRPEQPGALTLTPLAIQGVLAAYSNAQSGGKGWIQHQKVPTYLYSREKDRAQIEWRPATKLDLETLWQQIRTFSDLDGDVLLAVLAQWMSYRDEEGSVWISSDHILNYRGIQPRKYENTHLYHHRKKDLEAISASMDRIRDTHVTLRQWVKETPPTDQPRRQGRRKKQAIQLESYSVIITEFLKQQELPSENTQGLTIAWKCRLGSCLEPFISGPNRQTAYLLQQALSYDPRGEFWEKRLARLVTFHLRMSAQGGSTTWQIRNIFEELSLPQNRSDPDKTRRRFEKAWNRLQADEQISAWSYQEPLTDLPAKKWLEVWLDFHVQITVSPLPRLSEPKREQMDTT